jgi:hypothetical protein
MTTTPSDALLFGANPLSRVTGLHVVGGSGVRCYHRSPEGVVSSSDHPFFPFFHLSDKSLISGFSRKHWVKELHGPGAFRYLCAFESWASLWEAVRHVLMAASRGVLHPPSSYTEVSALRLIHDPLTQFHVQSGITQFRDMRFSDVVRMQIVPVIDPERPGHLDRTLHQGQRLLGIGLSDSLGWTSYIDGSRNKERVMFQKLVDLINKRDPDVLEGHHLASAILPMMLKRSTDAGIPFAIGRDESVPAAERGAGGEYGGVEIAGRHVVDAGEQESQQGHSSGQLPSAGKGAGALTEAMRISEVLLEKSRKAFGRARMIPMPYGSLFRSGLHGQIDSLFLRGFLSAREALPQHPAPPPRHPLPTATHWAGVHGPVVQLTIDGLYPSVLRSADRSPAGDSLRVFLTVLRRCLELHEEATQTMSIALDSSPERDLAEALHGYLSYPRAVLQDQGLAFEMTRLVEKQMAGIREALSGEGAKVVLIDNASLFVVPPGAEENRARSTRALLDSIRPLLADDMKPVMAATYRMMLVYKRSTFALLTDADTIELRGTGFSSHTLERFAREFLQSALRAILHHDFATLHSLYAGWRDRIETRRWTITDFLRTEHLRISTDRHADEVVRGVRVQSPAHQALEAANRGAKAGEPVAFYMSTVDPARKGSGSWRLAEEWDPHFPDESTLHYLHRLDECASKFRSLFSPKDFSHIFSSGGLFPFDPENIRLLEDLPPDVDENGDDSE